MQVRVLPGSPNQNRRRFKMLEEKCENCRFWVGRYGEGICRRRAPTVVGKDHRMGEDTSMHETAFPTTRDHIWCGEFERRQPDQAERSAEALMNELKSSIDLHLAHKAAALDAVVDVMRLCQHAPEEWLAMSPELRDFKQSVMNALEIRCLNLGFGLESQIEEDRKPKPTHIRTC